MANKKTETRQEVSGSVSITKGMAKAGNLAGKAQFVEPKGNEQGIRGSLRDLKKSIVKSQPTPVKTLNPQGKTMGQIADEVAQNIKTHTPQGVLGNSHMGGHSDVMGAVNLGGFTVKTPIIKPSSTKNK